MALPEKVIEKLSREPVRTPGWSGRLLMFSSTILFLSVFVYVGIKFGYQPYLRRQVNDLNDQIQAFSQEIPVGDQAKLIAFYSQLANVKSLLDNHIMTSPLFVWLEKNTHVNVYFSKFSLNTGSNQLLLSGTAKSARDVGDQVRVFQSQPEVRQVNVGNMAATLGGQWTFDLTLTLDSRFLRQPLSEKQ